MRNLRCKHPTNCPSVYRGTSPKGGGSSKRSAEFILNLIVATRYAYNAPAYGTPSINRGGVANFAISMLRATQY